MLAAMLLMGFATAVAAPIVIEALSDDDDIDDAGEEAQPPVEQIEVTEPDPPEPAQPEPATFTVSADAGVVTIDAFQPGVDRLEIHVAEPGAELDVSAPDDGGITLSHGSGGVPVVISFPGLDAVPFDDIDIVAVDPAPLAPLAPVDPDQPDEITPAIDEPALVPISPDLADEPDTEPLDTAPLAPVPGDVVDPVSEIEGFVAGQDILRVTVLSDLPPEDVFIEVVPSSGAEDGYVFANGDVIAVLRDTPVISLEDLSVTVSPAA
ncbi:MAG: hypothetical protein KJO15_09920 [Alphaproteobacteria bacterium]|nr:hypothetical protein [Alphaproteobacteria bacterium]NNF70941.1 hypothetical protein [Paracoccaceae bacterium]